MVSQHATDSDVPPATADNGTNTDSQPTATAFAEKHSPTHAATNTATATNAIAMAAAARTAPKAVRGRKLEAFRFRMQLAVIAVALGDIAIMLGTVIVAYAVLANWIWAVMPIEWRDSSGVLHPNLHVWYKTAVVAFSIMAGYTFAVHGLYRPSVLRQRGTQVMLALRAVSVLAAFFYFAVWMDRMHYPIERQIVVLVAWGLSCVGIGAWRGWIVAGFLRSRLWRRRAIILGAGTSGQFLAKQRRHFARAGFDIVGFLDDRAELHGTTLDGLPVAGPIADAAMESAAAEHRLDEVLLAISNVSHGRMLELVALCKRHGLEIRVLSDLWGILAEKVNVETISGVPLVSIRETPLMGLNAFLKRAIDIMGSGVLLVMLAPVMLAVTAAVKLTSPGPAVFRQTRVGYRGAPFTCYKFRSMRVDNDDSIHRQFVEKLIRGDASAVVVDAESGEAVRKLVHDPRITPIGNFLRKYSLDELPQLWNVFVGDMSLVGPRPPVPYEVEAYDEWHRKRLDIRPGITGLWQVTSRSEVTFDEMVILDTYYIENWSLWLDLKLILLTPFAVFARKGAH